MGVRQGRGARYDAYHNGELHYNGSPCKNCKTTLKFTSNYSCVYCQSKAIKRKNKEYKRWQGSEKGRMGLATFKKKDIIDKIALLSNDQIEDLEKKIDLMLTQSRQ